MLEGDGAEPGAEGVQVGDLRSRAAAAAAADLLRAWALQRAGRQLDGVPSNLGWGRYGADLLSGLEGGRAPLRRGARCVWVRGLPWHKPPLPVPFRSASPSRPSCPAVAAPLIHRSKTRTPPRPPPPLPAVLAEEEAAAARVAALAESGELEELVKDLTEEVGGPALPGLFFAPFCHHLSVLCSPTLSA